MDGPQRGHPGPEKKKKERFEGGGRFEKNSISRGGWSNIAQVFWIGPNSGLFSICRLFFFWYVVTTIFLRGLLSGAFVSRVWGKKDNDESQMAGLSLPIICVTLFELSAFFREATRDLAPWLRRTGLITAIAPSTAKNANGTNVIFPRKGEWRCVEGRIRNDISTR